MSAVLLSRTDGRLQVTRPSEELLKAAASLLRERALLLPRQEAKALKQGEVWKGQQDSTRSTNI